MDKTTIRIKDFQHDESNKYQDYQVNQNGKKAFNGGGGSGLPTVEGSGKALVSVNGEWVEQYGYGYTNKIIDISWDGSVEGLETIDLSPSGFEGVGTGYKVAEYIEYEAPDFHNAKIQLKYSEGYAFSITHSTYISFYGPDGPIYGKLWGADIESWPIYSGFVAFTQYDGDLLKLYFLKTNDDYEDHVTQMRKEVVYQIDPKYVEYKQDKLHSDGRIIIDGDGNIDLNSRIYDSIEEWDTEVYNPYSPTSIQLPYISQDGKSHELTYRFTALYSDLTITAPAGMILSDDTGFEGLSEANSITYSDLSVGSIYELNFKKIDNSLYVTHIAITKKEWKMGTPDYLCFTAEEANSTIKLVFRDEIPEDIPVLEYSVDNMTTWNDFTIGDNGTIVTLDNIGDKMYLRGDNDTISTSYSTAIQFVMTGKIAASGNIISLLDKKMEKNAIRVNYCFNNLFRDCVSLTTAPKLGGKNGVTDYSFAYMFYGCTSLTTVPKIVDDYPMAAHTYDYMFYGCSSLTSITVSFRDWYKPKNHWVEGVASNGTFTCKSTLKDSRGVDYIPSGWTKVNL